MNRELKFRVFKDRVFHYWGFIDDSDGMVFTSPPLSGQISDIQKISEQFTGLLDKNGVEIYEGTILEVELSAERAFTDGKKDIFRLEAHFGEDGGFHGRRIDDGSSYSLRFSGSAVIRREVIGNIHENPELLET